MWLSLQRNTIWTTITVHYDCSLLNNRDICDKYLLTLRNKFDALSVNTETHTPNDKYENFVNAKLEAAQECIPIKQKAKFIIPWETLMVLKNAGRRDNCLQMQSEEPKPIPMPWNLKMYKMNS